ncbi:sigma-54-dependent transcriptional regulator [Plasticicumulans acidivorans]|uniref:Two component Fis family sigma54 specific transcriptional regulator n=1 Tax=Plasticicumulans acidivorans TaxID=886464 RepID=A0A317N394_9GAMM|nr:sigma-54 dependent transcriptional regulator [Plasticicumulans acidivorans]PWV64607.1 two component Fis family sigma54 specific transcriptional regulator [Plasticicumulans acidivorans]
MSAAHILVVDDEPDIRDLVKEILEDEGYEVSTAENGATAREARRARRPDLVLLDIWMPDIDGISLLKEWAEGDGLPCPVIMMSGHGTVETAVEATRLGAYDFIEKPLSMAKLLLTVERALEADKLRRENIGLRRQARPVAEPVGRSDTVQKLKAQAQRIALHEAPVLITGEPGTGKEIYARFIHASSPRKAGPFIDVGVGSIARENSALELFGSEAGDKVHYGRLEQASGGTLFLDELADMAPETQAKLAGALENGSFLRIGGKEPVQVNVRVIAASHRDLETEVHAGRLREDLYYHLNVLPMRLPPLREHCEDVPELLTYYVNFFVDQEGLPYRNFTMAARNRLRNYGWPGNIRELKNLVQRLLILGGEEEITLEEVEAAISHVQPNRARDIGHIPLDLPLREAREQFERNYLLQQFKECDGNVARLAEKVGMERTNLYRKLRALGIDPKRAPEDE